ncbi:precorrin-4 C(11)-methyltransferase [Treponema putidum]|uniref:Precorrin-4 C(11)-methyltransferase n=1 Tax=Treponema putidum TaxID=221027 RepID=A0AAE9MUY9_9SPIR|nr:precorrin-4 C(11)-methyltransferase [Treponema putidum]AIN93168.1 cobalt-precorrin-4 C(11)-methyltransferase [Treponema putidum]TWI78652.1 cobalt-precorrin 4 C11-methyltransferase [Treponema putidum]UTY29410.1 precorrin-4 C(11)-methyltransferase [Treponema putidum]UTY31904.1 precorrin-4 C(11)-methyltransferase [Treponema putidum]UTY34266.1 precorrin-4 C(11)-methyltransferase [Treponema putidum]
MVYFVGAGPGDPDLITVKGRKLIEKADVIIYAGSLVSAEHLMFAKHNCKTYNSASMTLEEVIKVMNENRSAQVVRLHTGDPSIYGAIREQMDALDKLKIDYEVIPGVSSYAAAAAAIKKEFTLPDVSQTVILTRMEGRTPVPQDEKLASLAAHKASMAIFLSVQNIENVVAELLKGYKDEATPVAVIYKASWEDQEIIIGTLGNIAQKVKKAGVNKTAQILVGNFIAGDYERSQLYNPEFSHEFRKAEK